MPFGIWDSPHRHNNVEHTPLSTYDDDDVAEDEGENPFPPYSDSPPPSPLNSDERNPGSGFRSDSQSGSQIDGSRRSRRPPADGAANSPSKIKARNAINIQEETRFLRPEYEDEDDDGYDDYEIGDPFDRHRSPHKKPSRRHRGRLVWAHLRRCTTRPCCRGDAGDTKGSTCGGAKPLLMGAFYLVLLTIILFCASAIGYIVARDGNPFGPEDGVAPKKDRIKLPPPPSNLHEVCTDWITETGRRKCQELCMVSECCSLPANDKGSCWEERTLDCATYRAACMALELHSEYDGDGGKGGGSGGATDSAGDRGDGFGGMVSGGMAGSDVDASSEGILSGMGSGGILLPSIAFLPPPPSYLAQICSTTSLRTPQGFESCADICRPSRCCHPETYGCEVDDRKFCDRYELPCANVAESWRGSGHAVATMASGTAAADGDETKEDSVANQVMLKCNAAK